MTIESVPHPLNLLNNWHNRTNIAHKVALCAASFKVKKRSFIEKRMRKKYSLKFCMSVNYGNFLLHSDSACSPPGGRL